MQYAAACCLWYYPQTRISSLLSVVFLKPSMSFRHHFVLKLFEHARRFLFLVLMEQPASGLALTGINREFAHRPHRSFLPRPQCSSGRMSEARVHHCVTIPLFHNSRLATFVHSLPKQRARGSKLHQTLLRWVSEFLRIDSAKTITIPQPWSDRLFSK